MYVHNIILICLPIFVSSAERNSTCTTPNGEMATCIPFLSCTNIRDAVLSDMNSNNSAIEFAKHSQCGYDSEPLVCCGSSAYPVAVITPPQSKLLPNSSECGMNLEGDRIFGGTVTEVGEFPWMVLLKYNRSDGKEGGFQCGGTLISERYVLTAAHCVKPSTLQELTLVSVRLGEWKISTERDCYEGLLYKECVDNVIDLNVEKAIGHPNYSRRSGDNDIGLIRLERNVKYSNYIRPICLPSFYAPIPEAKKIMVISGWGTTENDTHSDVKLKAYVPIVSNDVCSSKFKNRGAVGENQVCAGGEAGKDACQGDSGGPLMRVFDELDLEPQWFQEGVIAWGIGCGRKGIPGIYTRVAKYMYWILQNMEEF